MSDNKLAELVARFTDSEGCFLETQIPSLTLCRRNLPTEPKPCLYPLSLIVIVQGTQQLNYGKHSTTLAAGQSLLTTVDLPVISNVASASRHTPYLSLRIELNPLLLQELLEKMDKPEVVRHSETIAFFEMDQELTGAIIRLVKLLDEPQLRPQLAPLIEQEIAVRLLASEQHSLIRQLLTQGSIEQKISKVISYLKQHYAQNIEMNHLAELVYISPSSLRQHFRRMTGTSPLQYQKQLRLQHARRLMFTQHLDATTAALEVGYESPTQFNREYHRFFGEPPKRDIQRLREDEMRYGRIV